MENQRHKKSKLSGQQNFTRKNFPDGVREFFFATYMCQKCINHSCNIYAPEVRKSLSENFQTVWKLSRGSGNLWTVLAHICRENDLRTPSGKFLRVRFCRPESFDFLCLCLVPPSSSCFAATKRDTSLLYVDLPPSPGQTTNPQWCPLIEAGFQVRPGEVTKARTMG